MSQDRMNPPSSLPRPDFFSEALRRVAVDRTVRPARRTLTEMTPGHAQRPVLRLAPNVRFLPTAAQDDACPLCGNWLCDGTNCRFGASAPARAAVKRVA
jgi:hypothetical protein